MDPDGNGMTYVYVDVLSVVKPLYAWAAIGHMMVVTFTDVVSKETFHDHNSFVATDSSGRQAHATDIQFAKNPSYMKLQRKLAEPEEDKEDGDDDWLMPFVGLVFDGSVDTYDVVTVEFTEESNELCEHAVIDVIQVGSLDESEKKLYD